MSFIFQIVLDRIIALEKSDLKENLRTAGTQRKIHYYNIGFTIFIFLLISDVAGGMQFVFIVAVAVTLLFGSRHPIGLFLGVVCYAFTCWVTLRKWYAIFEVWDLQYV